MTEHPPAEGARYGDYEVESFLGKGSIGKVYLARHRRIGRRVALKTVHFEHRFEDEDERSEFYKRLQREAELCGAMQHPNVVTLYDVGYDGDVVSFFATEYIDGESLLARLRRTRPLPLAEAISIASDVLRGLAYAHAKGIIHRDIKPANILLTAEGQAKIADFGVARPLHSSLTTTRTLVGTPNYMSPEQVKTTPVSTRSDLFSAGVVMYEMLTGIKPFAAPELSGILYNVVNLVPEPVANVNPDVPEPLSRLVQRLLAKTPEERYATASEALADLVQGPAAPPPAVRTSEAETVTIPHASDAGTPLPTVIDSLPLPEPPRSRFRRDVPPIAFWLVILLLLASLGGAVWYLRSAIARERPAAVITREQLATAQAKRTALENARALTREGRFEEAIAAYDALIARYPETTVARSEREATQRLLDEQTPQSSIDAEAPKRAKRPAKTETEEKRPSRWERVKRWFRGD